MRVIVFVENLGATGVVMNAAGIASELYARGCDVRLVAAHAEGTLKANIPASIPVVGLNGVESSAKRTRRLARAAMAYRRLVKSFRPDVILSAGNHAHMTSLFAASGSKTRVVVRVSNDLEHAIGGMPSKDRWWRAAKFRLIAALADRLVFVSRHLRDQAAAIADLGAKSAVIPNGVDVDSVRRRANEVCPHPWLEDSSSVPVIVAVGRLVRQKNQLNLVRAIAIARAAAPIRLLLIGSGPLREAIFDEVRSLGLSDVVDIIPPVANPMPYMARAAVVALPSWWEGASNVLLEAMACDTPVVASRMAGTAAEVLDNGRYGLLVDPADVEELARALLWQCGPWAVRPDNRAHAFCRKTSLQAYADLTLGGTGQTGRAFSFPSGAEDQRQVEAV